MPYKKTYDAGPIEMTSVVCKGHLRADEAKLVREKQAKGHRHFDVWGYDYKMLAKLFGCSYAQVRKDVSNKILDPSDLVSIFIHLKGREPRKVYTHIIPTVMGDVIIQTYFPNPRKKPK